MQKLTDADRAAINRCIAEAMQYPGCILPDFFSDASAADRLLAWLRAQKYDIVLGICEEGHGGGCSAAIGTLKERQTPGVDNQMYEATEFAPDWKGALALACVEQGKFCPKCGNATKIENSCFHCRCGLHGHEKAMLNWRVRPELEGSGGGRMTGIAERS